MTERQLRRVVVSDVDGSTLVEDVTLAVSIRTPTAAITDVWVYENDPTVDHPPPPEWTLLPPEAGATWRIVEFKAGTAEQDLSRGMHSTPTADMGIVVAGEILLVLEDLSQVRLGAGDTFVLRGIQHTWANDTDESCMVAIVLAGRSSRVRSD